MITVAIPIKQGELISPIVLHGISSQTIHLNVVVSTQDPDLNEQREKSINNNRHQLQKCIVDYKEKYIVLLDSDVVLTDKNTIASMMSYLDENNDVGCVAIDTKNLSMKDNSHVILACAVIRYEIYKTIDYSKSYQCQCFIISSACTCRYINEISAYELDHAR